MNESRHMWMCHISHHDTCECHISHLSKARHTHEWILRYVNVSYFSLRWEIWHIHMCRDSVNLLRWEIWHMWMCHISHLSKARHTHEWILRYICTSRTWMSHVIRMYVSWHTRMITKGLFCKRALKNRWDSAKETYNFKEPTHENVSCLPSKCDTSHTWTSHVSHIHESWRRKCVMSLLLLCGGYDS